MPCSSTSSACVCVQPAVLHRLLVQERPRIRRRQRHLDGVRVDLGGEADRLLDRLLRLARQAQDEGAVDLDAELVAVLGEALARTSIRMPFLMLCRICWLPHS